MRFLGIVGLALFLVSPLVAAEGKLALEAGILNGFGIALPVSERASIRVGTGLVLTDGYSVDLRLFREPGQLGRYWYLGAYRVNKFLGFPTSPSTIVTGGPGKTWSIGKHFQWGAEIGPSYQIDTSSFGVGINIYLRTTF